MIAVLFMILWTASYSSGWAHSFPRMSSIYWHAHEMLYGYAMAVIAGFLLTAVCNWTGQPALQGTGLMFPFYSGCRQGWHRCSTSPFHRG